MYKIALSVATDPVNKEYQDELDAYIVKVRICVYFCLYTHIHIHMHTCSCIYLCTYTVYMHTYSCIYAHTYSLYLHTQMFGKSKEMHEGMKSMIALDRKVSNNIQSYACMHASMHAHIQINNAGGHE